MTQIIDGTSQARKTLNELKEKVISLQARGITPGLDVILVGNNPASEVYVNLKSKRAEEIGIRSRVHRLDAETPRDDIISLIQDLNQNSSTHGILVQLPLPHRSHEDKVLSSITPQKDVDGLHPVNQGKLMLDQGGIIPCTPKGCLYLLRQALGKNLSGKHAVIMGRSSIVGKPMGFLLLNENCTVTYVHSKTQNPQDITRQADILITAIGNPHMVTKDWIKPGVCIIDVGINREQQGLVGDVDFESVQGVAEYITPVPGGVGPMTIAMLLQNTVEAAEKSVLK